MVDYHMTASSRLSKSDRAVHRVVMLAYDDAQILDITGPLEVFSRASRWLVDQGHRKRPAYTVEVVASVSGPLRTSSGIDLVARRAYREVRSADTLLVTGGIGFAEAARDSELLSWIQRMGRRVRRIGSICTGALVLAAAGVLKGRPATTHWAYCDLLSRAEPTADVHPDAIYVRSDNVYTSAGVTTGMDMALAMVEEDFGRQAAIGVAQQLVMFLMRPGGQSQFSRLLKAQARAGGRLEALALWIEEHLDADLTVPVLARRASMSPRNFARRFVEECGATPAVFVEQMRVEAARCQLQDTHKSIEEIARRCGFRNNQHLRRAFLRSLGVTPTDYRERFRSDVEPKG